MGNLHFAAIVGRLCLHILNSKSETNIPTSFCNDQAVNSSGTLSGSAVHTYKSVSFVIGSVFLLKLTWPLQVFYQKGSWKYNDKSQNTYGTEVQKQVKLLFFKYLQGDLVSSCKYLSYTPYL
jgi:hypothetical protein